MKILYHHRNGSKNGQAVHIAELTAALKNLGCDVVNVMTEGSRISERQEFGERSRLVAMLKRRMSPYHFGVTGKGGTSKAVNLCPGAKMRRVCGVS